MTCTMLFVASYQQYALPDALSPQAFRSPTSMLASLAPPGMSRRAGITWNEGLASFLAVNVIPQQYAASSTVSAQPPRPTSTLRKDTPEICAFVGWGWLQYPPTLIAVPVPSFL